MPKHNFYKKVKLLPGMWLLQHSGHALHSLALSGLVMLNAQSACIVT